MKKILLLAALFLAGQAAAQTRIEITRQDGSQPTYGQQTITYNDSAHAIVLGWQDTIAVGDMKSLRFTRDGLPWNLQWKLYDGDNGADRFGYGAVMHIRDMMTGDMWRPDQGYNWFSNWERTTFIGKQYARSQTILNTMRTLTIEANGWIKALKEAGADSEGWLGAAYACRAMAYLDMARMYEFLPNDRIPGISDSGEDITGLTVPLIDETTEIDLQTGYYNVPRATKAEAVAFILNDLDRAEQLITKLNEPSHMLPHLDAVYGLKARLYLWTEDYNSARLYARKAIEATDSHIMTSSEMTDKQKGFNDLSPWMWGVQHFAEDRVVTSGYVNWTSWMSNEYFNGYSGINYGTNALYIDKSLYDRISDSDVRKRLFVAPSGTALYYQLYEMTLDMALSEHPYASLKFRPNHGETTNKEGLCTAFPLMRVEEMYLIEAEAAAHLSPAEGAALLERFVRENRDASYACRATSAEEVINEVILQKRIELWGEGQTYFDLKRLNMSVTRDYENTNIPGAYRFNTVGRPAWMNFVFTQTEENRNLGLMDRNNPDPSEAYAPGHKDNITDAAAQEAITSQIVLHEPRFKADVNYVPLDAVSYFLLHYDEAQHTDDVSLTYSVQVSISPNFPQGGTILTRLPISSYDLYSSMQYLLKTNGLPATGNTTVYVRVRGKVNQTASYFAYSNVVSFGVSIPEEGSEKTQFDYLPTATFSIPAPIDVEKVIEQDRVKVCDITLSGEGELKNYYQDYDSINIRRPVMMELDFTEKLNFYGNYSIDAEGYADNAYGRISQDLPNTFRWNNVDFMPRIEVPATCSYDVQRNDLAVRRTAEKINITILPNRQEYDELGFTWDNNYKTIPMTSTVENGRFSGDVNYQKAKSDETVYRFIEPYATRRNLLFYADGQGGISVPSQCAYTTENGLLVRVSGSGVLTKGQFDMQLTFTQEDGTVLGTFNELFGEKSDWVSLGRATITDDCFTTFWSVENVSWKAEILESTSQPRLYRLVNPYNTLNYPYNEVGDFDDSQDYYLDIHAEDPECVWFGKTPIGVDWNYGMISLWTRADYYISQGNTPEAVKNAGWYGTLKNGRITFPQGGILISLANYKDGALYAANNSGMFSIVLPGYSGSKSEIRQKDETSARRPIRLDRSSLNNDAIEP